MNISIRLKQARQLKGYTQVKLANAIGMSRGVITNIEYGKVEPQPIIIKALCDVLQINEAWLLTGKGKMENREYKKKGDHLLSEIYSATKRLSVEEQDYILDIIKTFQKHIKNIKSND